MKYLSVIALSALAGLGVSHKPASAEANPFLADIQLTAITFCPRGWANADGQLLAISSHQALFSLLGTQFGGDGRTTFALPDLRSRIPVGSGKGAGLSNYNAGQMGGAEGVTVALPAHSHTATSVAVSNLNATDNVVDVHLPQNARLGVGANAAGDVYASAGSFDTSLQAGSVTTTVTDTLAATGSGQLQNNLQPLIAMRFCIATDGQFPSRN